MANHEPNELPARDHGDHGDHADVAHGDDAGHGHGGSGVGEIIPENSALDWMLVHFMTIAAIAGFLIVMFCMWNGGELGIAAEESAETTTHGLEKSKTETTTPPGNTTTPAPATAEPVR